MVRTTTLKHNKASRKLRIPLNAICLTFPLIIFLCYLLIVHEIHEQQHDSAAAAADQNNQQAVIAYQQQHQQQQQQQQPSSTISTPVEEQEESLVSQENEKPSYQKIIEDTTRILYANSPHLQTWLDQPPLKVYVYDTIPDDWGNLDLVSQCIEENHNIPTVNYDNCHWDPQIPCSDRRVANSTKETKFMSHRQNYNSDFAYIRWFRDEYPYRTMDAAEADLYVVPYPHWSHCICHRERHKRPHCSYHNLDLIQEKVLQYLEYYKGDNKKRHLFFLGVDWGLASRGLRQEAQLSLGLGAALGCQGKKGQVCGHFVSPYLSTATEYQPSAVSARMVENPAWISEQRSISVGAALGTPPNLYLRREFIQNKTRYLGDDVGGVPHEIIDLGSTRQQLRSQDIMALYGNSTFCPILPGDGCPQKRFFDVLLSGCIPVVPFHDKSAEEGTPSFFTNGACSVRSTYPFAKGTFFGDDTAGINYADDLVVPFNGTCGLSCMKGAMEAVIKNDDELQRLRRNIQTYVRLFAFGLGPKETNQRVDAFAASLVQIRHYLRNL